MAPPPTNAASIQFFTTGFGDWRRVLPAGPIREFYGQIYPEGRRWPDIPASLLESCRVWVECDLARADGDRLTPLIPILLRRDREVLRPWFAAFVAETVAAVHEALPAFRRFANQFSDRWNSAEHLLSILILWSINMWVLRRLLDGPLGRHPAHGTTGRYFIWGEEVGGGPTSITGIRAMRGAAGYGLCLIVSRIVERPLLKEWRRMYAPVHGISAVDLLAALAHHGPDIGELAQRWSLDEHLLRRWYDGQVQARVLTTDTPPRLRIPVFGPEALAQLAPACDGVAERITAWLLGDTLLAPRLERCSFARCPSSAVLCMLWHNSYYEATDRLIAQDILPAFPPMAEGEWGVWLTSHPFGRAPTDLPPPR
jgi:hypothetical protein